MHLDFGYICLLSLSEEGEQGIERPCTTVTVREQNINLVFHVSNQIIYYNSNVYQTTRQYV